MSSVSKPRPVGKAADPSPDTRSDTRKPRKPKKPAKPHKDFPLFAHASGRWAKKVRGRLVYFGKWDDHQAALEKWLEQKDELLAGRQPRKQTRNGIDLVDLADRFMEAKQRALAAGDIGHWTFSGYMGSCRRLLSSLGRHWVVEDLRPEDFAKLRDRIAKTRGPVGIANEIRNIRGLFKWGFDSGLIDRPVRFGPDFKLPSAAVLRRDKQSKPVKLFEAEEIRELLKLASPTMRAMILLGVNCGLGNSDLASLPLTALDLDRGVLNYPRPKTAVERRATLWPETVKALREVIANRPKPKLEEDAGLVFITKYGHRWARLQSAKDGQNDSHCNAVTLQFGKLRKAANVKRHGVGFYSLRHVFETVAGETGDQPAVNRIMGHADHTMAGRYREWRGDAAEDERLRKVTQHVAAWLWPAPAVEGQGRKPKRVKGKAKLRLVS